MLSLDFLKNYMDEDRLPNEFYLEEVERTIFLTNEDGADYITFDDEFHGTILFGLKDSIGNIIIEANYVELSLIGNKYFVAKNNNGTIEIFDINGNDLYEYRIDELVIGKDYILIREDYTLLCLDTKLNELKRYLLPEKKIKGCELSAKIDLYEYSSGYTRKKKNYSRFPIVKKNGKCGIVYMSGAVYIPFLYDNIDYVNHDVMFTLGYTRVLIPQDKVFSKQFEMPVSFTTPPEHYLFVDTETTGLYNGNDQPRLVQISWIVSDSHGGILKTCDYIVKPDGYSIPITSTKIHGISNDFAQKNGCPLSSVIHKFNECLSDVKYVVGHNIDFDFRIIYDESARIGIPINNNKIFLDTMEYGTYICGLKDNMGNDKKPQLAELYKTFFKDNFENAHNSLADIKATFKCFWKMRKYNVI